MEYHRVHIAKCADYDLASVRRTVREAVEGIGGLPLKPSDKVLLKPNLLAPRPPEKAVTTHPALIAAVAELVLDCGAITLIGDSPGGSPGDVIWSATGMNEVLEKYHIARTDFTSSGMTEVEIRGNNYFLASASLECDLLINLPKLKTHSLTMFTGAVKNLYGCLPGFQKGNWHRRAPKNEQFSQVVVDIFSKFRPKINIIDGILAMEGDGPSNGKAKKLGIILAGDNAPALDRVASRIIGFEDDEILTTRFAELRGFTLNAEKTILTGVPIEEVTPADFVLPKDRYLQMIPHLAHEILGKLIWVRPEVDKKLCSECGDCVANCPAKAMSMDNGPAVIDHKVCISCYCCDEVCSVGAIEKKMSWLARRLS